MKNLANNLSNEFLIGRLDSGNLQIVDDATNELINRYYKSKLFREYPLMESIVKKIRDPEYFLCPKREDGKYVLKLGSKNRIKKIRREEI